MILKEYSEEFSVFLIIVNFATCWDVKESNFIHRTSFTCQISLTSLISVFSFNWVDFGFYIAISCIFISIGEISAFYLQGMDDTQVRSAATDIFSYLVEYNPSMVREFVMQEAQQNDDVSKKLTEQKITNKVNIICTNSKYLYMGS